MNTANGVWSVGPFWVEYGSPMFFVVLCLILAGIYFGALKAWRLYGEGVSNTVGILRGTASRYGARARMAPRRETDRGSETPE